MAYADNAALYSQEHFTVLEIDLPAFSSGQTCTLPIAGGTGYHTPLTCTEAWDTTTFKTYYFATANTPLAFGRPPSSAGMPGDVIEISDPIRRVIKGVTEQVTELRPGEGLAIQGSANITLIDFDGDPGPVGTTTTGTYFGKLASRNILNNKEVRIKYYHVQDGNIYAADDALTHYYYIDSFKSNGKGAWTLSLKDELSKLDDDRHQFPEPTGGTIRVAVDNTTTTIPVDATTDWEQKARPYTIKVGDEFMKVTAVTGNQTGSASLTVATRGNSIAYTNTISLSVQDAHAVDDDIQICYTSDDQAIDDFLYDVLIAADIPASVIPTTDWASEIALWHPTDKLDMIWHEPTATNEVVRQVCNDFLLDIWFDAEDREVKLSAISVWKVTGPSLTDGEQINRDTFKVTPRENLRYSRAFVYHNKPNKLVNNDIENFRAVSINIASTPEGDGQYGEPKTKEFDNSPILGTQAAALLVQRTTARFGYTPYEYQWETEEKFLNFKTGDIAVISTPEVQDFDGTNKAVRAQITSVQPVFGVGRHYRCKALSYEGAFASGSEIDISTTSNNVNLHTLAGAPPGVVDITFVISANVSGNGATAITAGAFATGSTLTLIVTDSAELRGQGGVGGAGGDSEIERDGESSTWYLTNDPGGAGGGGGTVYDAQGIDTDIYLGGTVDGHTAIGTLYAPGGGGGGEEGQGIAETSAVGGGGGGGGAGATGGAGGTGGTATKLTAPGATTTDGADGSAGTTTGGAGAATAGAGGAYGAAGTAASGAAGAAGKGIVLGGATVNVYTDGNTGRLINGGGDTVTVT